MSKSVNEILSISLLIICFLIVKFITIESLYIGGHDSFQYIEWARVLGTQEQNLQFFRPLLYLILKISHFVSDWDPRTFKVLLISIGCFNLLLYFYLTLKITNELSLAIIVTALLIINENFMVADVTGEITQIEFFFCSIFFCSIVFHKKWKSNFSFLIVVICALPLPIIHEEKVLLALITFYLAFEFKTFLKLSSSVMVSLGLLYLYLNQKNVEDFIEITYLVGRAWNSPFYLINNPIETLNDMLLVTDPVTSATVLVTLYLSLTKTVNFTQRLQLVQSKSDQTLFYSCIFYIILIGVLFRGVELSRTIGVVVPFMAIYTYRYILNFISPKFLSLAVVLSICHNLLIMGLVRDIDPKKSGIYYEQASIALSMDENKCKTLLNDESYYEPRTAMWGSDPNYGLKSKVYFYHCYQ